MKVIIIEDELLAQAKLEAMLTSIDASVTIEAKIGSVKEAVKWLQTNRNPDVAFVDIQLSDDHSFEIFRKIQVTFPVVFTTAYDQFLLESFEFNSIDYLLKPISEEKLRRSLSKLKSLQTHFTSINVDNILQQRKDEKERRFIVKKGTEFITLKIEDIAYFFTEHRIVFVKDITGKQYIIDKNLSELESSLDHQSFFRINRKYIANLSSIEKYKSNNGKIRVFLKPEVKEEINVSKETAPEFRRWIGATD
ncbi:MAG TPA: LytTR family DNA-binding domain-containing protein [Chryseosolibacter sp.]|nr:LytTR family DNA-binding domain-containing protein [Chryseosolibacter sp.]